MKTKTVDAIVNRLLFSGEPSRTRTCDPLVKSQLLYQLSYRPTNETEFKVSSFEFQVRFEVICLNSLSLWERVGGEGRS